MITDEIRFCPRCGEPVVQELRFGKLRPVCQACDWVYFADPKVAVVVIAVDKNTQNMLFVRRVNDPQRGMWTLPGGFMDAGEDPQQAAARECVEETGMTVQVIRLLDLEARKKPEQGAHLVLYYLAEILSGDLIAGDDADAAAFFPIDQLPPLAFLSSDRLFELLNTHLNPG
jgi:8-oxo-dGTP diphosphatase